MVGASHGKFFSHSEFDFNANNPFANPPPIDEFRTYSPINSTDATIHAAAEWVLQRYQDWTVVPELDATLALVTGECWIRSLYIASKVPF